ncbi:MAG TPA: hypothetical protein VFT81_02840 [Dermatophilaceae bacterium]|nr:hypothetical protein [Dermatophilaceae bacterium]
MMLVDCQACPVRDVHCADCMVTALTRIPMPTLRRVGAPAEEAGVDLVAPAALDPAERRAVSILLAAGLVDREQADRAEAWLEPPRSASRRAVG